MLSLKQLYSKPLAKKTMSSPKYIYEYMQKYYQITLRLVT